MRCPRCRQNNDGSAEKCHYCGAVLTESVVVTGLPVDKRPPEQINPNRSTESIAPLISDLLRDTPLTPVPPAGGRSRTSSTTRPGMSVDDLLDNSDLASWNSFDRQERSGGAEEPRNAFNRNLRDDIPDWVKDVNYINLPKRAGYIIFADEEGIAHVAACANPIRQLMAGIIDLIFITILASIGYFIANSYFINDKSFLKDLSLFLAIAAGVMILYNMVRAGRTLGKGLMHLRVVKKDGSKPPFSVGFNKGLYGAIPLAILVLLNYIAAVVIIPFAIIFPLGYLTALIAPEYRTLPDRLSGTYVIDTANMWIHGRDF